MNVRVAVVLVVLGATGLAGQSAPSPSLPRFDAASIRSDKSGGDRGGRILAGRFEQTNVSLRQLVQSAYGRRNIVDGPAWIDSDRFDVIATGAFTLAGYLPGVDGSPPVVSRMLQGLLIDRFRLLVHEESRTLPVYALVPARSDGRLGPLLRRSTVDCGAVLAAAAAGGRPAPPPAPGPPPCSIGLRPGSLVASGVTMAQLVNALSNTVDRPAVDRTGLSGYFDVEVHWAPGLAASTDAGSSNDRSADSAVSIFTAVDEQLGLKLEAARGPVDVLVIDRAERPAED